MRTLNGTPLTDEFNPFALNCLENYYLAETAADIETFVRNVISSIDTMKEQRTKFIEEEMMPKGTPSENIVNDILDSIDNQILYR